jgi:hypothetical protein
MREVNRKERHEKVEKWIRRLQMTGFVIEIKNLFKRYSHKYKFREENDCFLVCWSDRPLFSVSAWSFRR